MSSVNSRARHSYKPRWLPVTVTLRALSVRGKVPENVRPPASSSSSRLENGVNTQHGSCTTHLIVVPLCYHVHARRDKLGFSATSFQLCLVAIHTVTSQLRTSIFGAFSVRPTHTRIMEGSLAAYTHCVASLFMHIHGEHDDVVVDNCLPSEADPPPVSWCIRPDARLVEVKLLTQNDRIACSRESLLKRAQDLPFTSHATQDKVRRGTG